MPLFTRPGRGLDAIGSLIYDNNTVLQKVLDTGSQTHYHWVVQDGWAVADPVAGYLTYESKNSYTCADNTHANIFLNPHFHDRNNTDHVWFTTLGDQPCTPYGTSFAGSSYNQDGWYINITAQAGGILQGTITDSAGTVYHTVTGTQAGGTIIPLASVNDTNGNVLSKSFDVNTGYYTVIDSTGAAAFSYQLVVPHTSTYTGPGEATETVSLTYSSFTIQTNFQCGNISDINTPGGLVTSINLPDGSAYTLTYESTFGNYPSTVVTGRIHSITTPSGGTTTYTYSGGTNGINCTDVFPAIISKQTPDGTWSYTRSGPAPTTTTLTDPAGNDTVYSFVGLETQRVIYQGSQSSNNVVSKIITCYNGTFTSCQTQTGLLSVPITRKDAYTYPLGSSPPSLSETFYSNSILIQDNEFDFGVNTGSAPTTTPLKATKTTHATIGTVGQNILNRPSCVQITAGNSPATCGTVTSNTNSITKYLNYDAHGNVGTVQGWVAGSTYLSHSFTYYSSGLINTETDVNGAQATYTYGNCNNSYLTNIAEPLSLSRSSTWDCNGGVKVSDTDENLQVTQYIHNDPFWRLTQSADPLGNTTTYTYTPTTTESVLAFVNPASSTAGVDTLTTIDGMGRTSLVQTRQAPGSSNFDSVQYVYGWTPNVGAFQKVSTPYVGTPTAFTTTQYDAIGRITSVVDGGGGSRSFLYTSQDVLATVGPAPMGENTKRKQFEYDAIGRLKSVCEITSATGSGTCAQASSTTGLWTKYAYDALGNLISVTQNVQGSPVQTRTYAYDGLSRLISESNPEYNNLAATYNYDSDSAGTCTGPYNGDLIKKTDPAGNVTCSQFDQIHRVTGATFPSGPNAANTPPKVFSYDSTTFSCPNGSNVKTRLAEAYTGSSTSKITDVGFCYSPHGEVTDVWESTPNSGGFYHTTSSYWANGTVNTLAGFLASGSTFVPTQTYTPDGEGRWKSVAASSGPNPISSTAYNAASQITGITYGSTDSDSFLYDNAGRMKNYTFTINGSSEVSTPTWNANGTLQTLAITDPFNTGNAQTCTYAYDDLTRITSANCGTPWSQTFGYDPFGNITKSGSVSWQPGYNQSTNRYSLVGTTYDADGNLTNDTFHAYAWDSNGRPTSLGGKTITYDALGRMAEKLDGGTYTQFVYSPSGSLLARMSGQSATSVRVPLPGSWAVYGSSSTFNHYEHLDWLGNSRLSSSQSRTMTSDIAYAPFGEPYASTATSGVSFTGMRSDVIGVSGGVTNGLYDFLARELPPTQGRWLSPDPLGLGAADATDPQSWNLYAYVRNNPMDSTDPTGERCKKKDEQAGLCTDVIAPADDIDIAGPAGASAFVDVRKTAEQLIQNASDAIHQFLTAPRDPGCTNAITAASTLAGIGIGAKIGFGGGAFAGGVGGSFALPGGGTIGGAVLGGPVGATVGGAAGGGAGFLTGRVVGFVACRTGGGGGNTDHGDSRLQERGFSAEDIATTKTGKRLVQADGATVYLKDLGNGRFNVIVEGKRGIVTALKNIDQRAVNNLARNYGWR